MKKIFQTTFHVPDSEPGEGKGNCLVACVASILEFPIEAVPDWPRLAYRYSNSEHHIQTWLSCYGLSMETIFSRSNQDTPIPIGLQSPAEDGWFWRDGKRWYRDAEPRHYIVSGASPRGHCMHACVWAGGRIVHDPHPDGTGLKSTTQWREIIPIREFW